MKSTSLLIMFPLLMAFSCKPPVNDNAMLPAIPTGEWRLDSVALGKKADFATVVTVMLMNQDTSGVRFRFGNDTLFTSFSNEGDTVPVRFDAAQKRMHTLDRVKPVVYAYNLPNDSTCTLMAQDSSTYFLKRFGN